MKIELDHVQVCKDMKQKVLLSNMNHRRCCSVILATFATIVVFMIVSG